LATNGTPRTKIICLGEILIDLLAEEFDKPWQEVSNWEPLTGGAPANVAFGLARMGVEVSFMGCIGMDVTGVTLQDEMSKAGIDLAAVQTTEAFPTRKIYVERSASGERHFAGFGSIAADGFADAHMDETLVKDDLFKTAGTIVIGTLLFDFPESRKAITRAIHLSREQGLLCVMDVNRRDVFWKDPAEYAPAVLPMVKQMNIVKFSAEEAEWLFATANPDLLLKHLPAAEAILVSNGEQGSTWSMNGFTGSTPAFKVNSIDTTGAGDSFLAGFLYQYLLKTRRPSTLSEAEKIMEFASAMGALTTTKPGAVTSIPSEEEVEEFIRDSRKTRAN